MDTVESNHEMNRDEVRLSEKVSHLVVSDRRRYLEKISAIGKDPYCIPSSELSKDVVPPVQCTDIFNYLVLGKSFCTTENFKAFKSLEAYKYFECGFMEYLGGKVFNEKFVTIAKVRHSQRANDPLLSTWVICSDNGTVECADCTCMAGLGEVCSHAAALLFYLESSARVNLSCTQIGCQWNEPTIIETIPYSKLADLPFTIPKPQISCNKKKGAHLYDNTIPCSELPQPEIVATKQSSSGLSASGSSHILLCTPPSETEQMDFLSTISKHKPAINSIIHPFSDLYKPNAAIRELPPSLNNLYEPQHEELSYTELLEVCDKVTVSVTATDITAIEEFTRAQSRSFACYTQRAGRITASKMKSVCSTDPGNPAQSLIRQICYPHLYKFSTHATAWGCDHEAEATTAYVKSMNDHQNFTYKQSGLVVSASHPYIGASPDGIIDCDCCGLGILEVKCPYCIRMEDPSAASCLQNDNLDSSHQYYYQFQTQLFACCSSYADFVVATFGESQVKFVTRRILRDENLISEFLQKAEQFFKLCILPELVGKWYSRSSVMPTEMSTVDADGRYVYCYCKEDKGGDMIGYDNKECSFGEWFHLGCLKMKCFPRSGKWYCPNCRTLPEFSRRKRSRKQ